MRRVSARLEAKTALLTLWRALQISNKAIAFSCMGLGGIFLLTLLFHPLSPLSSSSASSASARLHGWYSGNFDKAGVYSADGALEPNPLPEGAKFGDVPFASVGGSWASASAVPEWAGGDAGAAKTESAIKPSEGKNLRWNGTHWFGALWRARPAMPRSS